MPPAGNPPTVPGVVVFDLDDTLVLERHYVRSGFRAVSQFVAQQTSISHDDCFASLIGLFDAGVRGDTFDRFIADRARSSANLTVANLVAVYRSHTPDIHLSVEVRELLERLRTARGVGLALVTDGPAVAQRNKIEALHLGDLMDTVVVTAELGDGRSKPHPAAFEQVQRHWPGVAADRFLYVGDNPTKDFNAPNMLGWTTVRLRQPGQLHRSIEPPTHQAAADITISALDGLETVVDQWWRVGA